MEFTELYSIINEGNQLPPIPRDEFLDKAIPAVKEIYEKCRIAERQREAWLRLGPERSVK